MFNLFRRSKKDVQHHRSSSALLCAFGDEPMISEDDEIYRKAGLEVFTERFVDIYEFARFMSDREVKVVHLYFRPDVEGNVPGLPAEDFFDCLLDSRTAILIIASENPPENTGAFTDAKSGWYDELAVVYTIDRKGANFKNFFSEIFSLMVHAGKSLPEAYVTLAPQNPRDPHEGCPATFMTF